jgi:serine/threonine protein phosphatase 1
LIYAVGDIHGRLDLLRALSAAIIDDARAAAPSQPAQIIFVGDYVDRGPESAGVIDHVLDLKARDDIVVHTLKGNHEQTMLDFLEDPRVGPSWSEYGGRDTLRSYNVNPPALRSDADPWEGTRQELAAALPPAHLQFLRSLELYAVCGDFVFVHAGLRPGVPLAAQNEQDLLWIRREFLESNRPFEKMVVYGHTPEREAVFETNRIGIDTGAFVTDVLTALKVSGDELTLIQTQPTPDGGRAVCVRPVAR